MATALLELTPTAATTPEEIVEGEIHSPLLEYIALLQIVEPLLKPPSLSLAADYALVKTRSASLHLTYSVNPL